ncbi:unnamed protein product [Peronospora destructor]|uniref:Carbohydrate-binding protein n=1 Tax=Peronospora destructor TaxID=86335 RepID=A0AAV0VEZ6_9STRA|nr:unnamed protein product [Peronospora destructor]
MPSSSWLLVVFVALTGTQSGDAAKSVFAASTSQCSSVATCYAGGASSTPCTVSDGGCPPCVTFADDGCYVKMNGACPFGSDCTSVWAGASTSTSDSTTPSTIPKSSEDSMPSTSTTTPSTSSTTPSTSPTTPSTSPTTPSTSTTTPSTTTSLPSTTAELSSKSSSDMGDMFSSSTSSSSSNSGDLEAGKTGSSDMSVVFAIIGAAIGVIAVAVIFLTLVRRSNAAHDEDEDDLSNTPLAFSKGPMVQTSHNTTGAATYSSYNGAPGMVSGTGDEVGNEASKGVSMNAVSYYNQQPMQNSAAPSSHVAGRAIPSQPVGMNASSSMARPYGGVQNFGVTGVGVTSGFGTSGFGQSGVGVNNQASLTPMQHVPMGSVAPSPQPRRESFEF